MTKVLIAVLSAAAVALAAGAAYGAPRHHVRSAPPAHPRVAAVGVPESMQPPHMIEARPGLFISSYGCITDDGYGRWLYCGQGRGGD